MQTQTLIRLGLTLLAVCFALPVWAEEDTEGCKDYPLFNRMPNYYLYKCDSVEFDARKFPVGPPLAEHKPKHVEVEGVVTYLEYALNSGSKTSSGLQIMRNFENATKSGGGTVEGKYPGDCTAYVEINSGCANWGVTMKFAKAGKEVWAYMSMVNYPDWYKIIIVERETMKQNIVVDQLLDKINKDGFISLYINFDTGKATIKPDSFGQLDQVVTALKQALELKLEVGGHTDNVGTPESNQTLSGTRAKSVMKYLTDRGLATNRLTAKGYGQASPVADNRSEDGRAKNRRVELVKK